MNIPQKRTNMEESKLKERIQEINQIVLSFAHLDFTKRAVIYGEDDVIDSLAAGINMLGEELHSSVISLHEKETLLKEIHHRVKNNLQIISSMLHLQSEFSKNAKVKKPLEECQSRILSMALLHEKLYESKDLRNIEINSYFDAVVSAISQSISRKNISIQFVRSQQEYHTHFDRLLPLGLVINELISNSLEHAFESNAKGSIAIELRSNNEFLSLEIRDNGKGFDPKEDTSNRLGLQLVDALVEQIDGTWKVMSDRGTCTTVQFNLGK